MEIHICKNCSLIEQTISNEIRKYDTISEENVSLHRALIKAKDDIVKQAIEEANLKDGLVAERRRNLQLSIQHETSMPTLKPSVNFILNSDLPKNKTDVSCKKVIVRSILGRSTDVKDEMISLSHYNQLVSLLERQREQYEEDLELYQDTYNKLLAKVKEQFDTTHEHTSITVDMYEIMRDDLFKERKEYSRARTAFQEIIGTIQNEYKKQLEVMKKQITMQVIKSANLQLKENLTMLQQQLAERDELVSLLREQQLGLEALISKQQLEHQIQQQKYKETIEDLKQRKIFAQKKYANSENRRQLEAQGFLSDISLIRKEIKSLKNCIKSTIQRTNVHNEIEVYEKKLGKLQEAIKENYTQKKSVCSCYI